MWSFTAPATVLAAPLAALLGLSAATPPPASAASYGTPGVCVRVESGLEPSLGTGPYAPQDGEPVSAFVDGFAEGPTPGTPDLRVLRRHDRIRGLALCDGKRTVARLPLPKDRRARVATVSVNGRRVAWRTTSGARGTLAVGTVTGRVVRAVRSSTTRALLGGTTKRGDRGRLLVTPDGSAAWSLPVGSRAGVWLWPSGERPRRIAVTKREDLYGATSPDVRIVDRHHVLIGSGTELARYGRRTPGRCPTGIGVTTTEVGPLSVRHSAGSRLELSEEGAAWSHILICDPAVGDYTRVIPFPSDSSGYGSSGDVSTSRGPTRVAFTAGMVVIERATSEYGGGSTTTTYDALVVPRDPAAKIRTATDGAVAGPGIDAPTPPSDYRDAPPTPIAVRVAPGAVAWTERHPESGVISVWLADTAGTRTVGTATPRTTTTPSGQPVPGDAALTLDAAGVTWNTPTGTGRAPVTPTQDSTLQTVTTVER